MASRPDSIPARFRCFVPQTVHACERASPIATLSSSVTHRPGGAVLRDEGLVRGHHLHATGDDALDALEKFGDLAIAQQVHQWMIRTRPQALPDHHLYPADLREQFLILAVVAAGLAKQLHVL